MGTPLNFDFRFMNKTAVACTAILAVGAIVCVYLQTSGNRYATANAGEGKIYLTDRKTGKSVLVTGTMERDVKPVPRWEDTKPSLPAENSILKAQNAHTLDPSGDSVDNQIWIHLQMEEMTGSLHIIGWTASRIDDQTYLVTYSFDTSHGSRCWAFEVNLKDDIVRNISGDPELEHKYGITQIVSFDDLIPKPVTNSWGDSRVSK
jgi:hypothetical protein